MSDPIRLATSCVPVVSGSTVPTLGNSPVCAGELCEVHACFLLQIGLDRILYTFLLLCLISKEYCVECDSISSCEWVSLPSTDSLLHSKPTMLELLDHVVLRVAARWYHFGLAFGVEDYLLEDIKATERGEVEACCADMIKRWLRGERATGGKERSWSTVLGTVQRCFGLEAASSIAEALQSAQ